MSMSNPTEDTPTHDPLKHHTDKAAKDYGKFKDAEVMDAMLPKQDDTLKFIDDPKIIAKAVEGSMDKRAAVLYPQDDQQLREAELLSAIGWTDFQRRKEAVKKLLTTAQIQLVSELMNHSIEGYPVLRATGKYKVVPLSVLKHKKQELEEKRNG